MGKSGDIITDLIFNIASNTAELKAGLSDAKNKIDSFSKGVAEIGNLIKGAFAATAIIGAAKQVFEFSQEIGKARDNVQSLSGLIGNDLTNATAKALAIADTFNIPFEKLLEGARAVSKEFGISIPDALDKIKQGYALTGSDEFLDTLKEYPAQFSAMGASADDFFKIATQSINEGVYSDKGADAVKEFGLRIRELTPAANDALTAIGLNGKQIQSEIANGTLSTYGALQKVSQRLSTFSDDSQQVGQVLADLFGGAGEDAGIRYIKMLGDASLSFKDLTNDITDAQKAQLHLSDSTEELNKIFVGLFGSSSSSFTELKADLLDIALVSFKAIKKAVVDTINYFIDLYNNSLAFRVVVQNIVFQFNLLIDIIKVVGKQLVNAFSTAGSLIKAVLTGNIKEIPKIIEASLKESVSNGAAFGKEVATDLKSAAQNVLQKEPIKLIGDDEAINQGAKAAQSFKSGFQKILSTVQIKPQVVQTGMVAPTIDSTALINKGDGVAVKLSDTTSAVKEQTTAWTNLGVAIQDSLGNIAVGAIDSVGQSLATLASTGKASFASLVKEILIGIGKIIQGLLFQAIAQQIASNSKAGLPGLILAAVGTAAVTALFSRLKVPAYAKGTDYASGGLSLVGERGAELVNLPRGSQVHNNRDTMRMLNSANKNLAISIDGRVRGEDIYFSYNETNRRRTS